MRVLPSKGVRVSDGLLHRNSFFMKESGMHRRQGTVVAAGMDPSESWDGVLKKLGLGQARGEERSNI